MSTLPSINNNNGNRAQAVDSFMSALNGTQQRRVASSLSQRPPGTAPHAKRSSTTLARPMTSLGTISKHNRSTSPPKEGVIGSKLLAAELQSARPQAPPKADEIPITHAGFQNMVRQLVWIEKERELISRDEQNENVSWHLDNFGTPAPLNRRDIKNLESYLDTSLEQMGSLVDPLTLEANIDILRHAQEVFSVCIRELIRQESVGCVERGRLLSKVWVRYVELFNTVLGLLGSARAQHLASETTLKKEVELARLNYLKCIQELERLAQDSNKKYQDYELTIRSKDLEMFRLNKRQATMMETLDMAGIDKAKVARERDEALEEKERAMVELRRMLKEHGHLKSKLKTTRRALKRVSLMSSSIPAILDEEEETSIADVETQTEGHSMMMLAASHQASKLGDASTGIDDDDAYICQRLGLKDRIKKLRLSIAFASIFSKRGAAFKHNIRIYSVKWLSHTIVQLYQQKIFTDQQRHDQGLFRQPLEMFIRSHFLQLYGLPTFADKKIDEVSNALDMYSERNPRARLLTRLTKLNKDKFSEDAGVVLLDVIQRLQKKQKNSDAFEVIFDLERSAVDLYTAQEVALDVLNFVDDSVKNAIVLALQELFGNDFNTRKYGETFVNAFNFDDCMLYLLQQWDTQTKPLWTRVKNLFDEANVNNSTVMSFEEYQRIMRELSPAIKLNHQQLLSIYQDVFCPDELARRRLNIDTHEKTHIPIDMVAERFERSVREQWALSTWKYDINVLRRGIQNIDLLQIRRESMSRMLAKQKISAKLIQRFVRQQATMWKIKKRQEEAVAEGEELVAMLETKPSEHEHLHTSTISSRPSSQHSDSKHQVVFTRSDSAKLQSTLFLALNERYGTGQLRELAKK